MASCLQEVGNRSRKAKRMILSKKMRISHVAQFMQVCHDIMSFNSYSSILQNKLLLSTKNRGQFASKMC